MNQDEVSESPIGYQSFAVDSPEKMNISLLAGQVPADLSFASAVHNDSIDLEHFRKRD
jgi:hypothetical protein